MIQHLLPPVGIYIPTYNRADLLRNCLAALQRQNMPKEMLQIYISDNASQDNTPDVVNSFRDLNIKYHRQSENIGHVANMYFLANLISNKYIMMVCDDDWLDDGYLRRAYEFLERNEDVVMHSAAAAYHDDSTGNIISIMRPMLCDASPDTHVTDVSWSNEEFISMCAVQTPVFSGCSLTRTVAFHDAILDDDDFYYSKEKIVYAKLLKFGSVYFDNRVGTHVRCHKANLTNSFDCNAREEEFRASTQRVIELAFEQEIDVPAFWHRKLAESSTEQRSLFLKKLERGFTQQEIASIISGNEHAFSDIKQKTAAKINTKAFTPSANKILAICTPNLGAISETFIKQHIQLLAPQRTVIVTGIIYDSSWLEAPLLQVPYGGTPFARFDLHTEEMICEFFAYHHVTHILCEFGCVGTEIVELNHRRLKLPLFVHFFGADASRMLRYPDMVSYYRWMGLHVDKVFTIAHTMTKRLSSIGIPDDKLHCIPLGVDIPPAISSSPDNSPCRFICVARLVPKKGIPYLLQAFALARVLAPEITLDLIGGGTAPNETGPQKQTIESIIQSLELGSSVRLHGGKPIEYVHQMFKQSSVYVQHSITDPETGDAEGLPIAILQASAAGLPIIATRHEGIIDEVEHEVTGFLVYEFDVESMAAYMALLARDPVSRKKMGFAAHHKVKAEFNVQTTIPNLRKAIGFD